MNPQPTITPPQRPGWWRRNWKWFVPVTLLSLLVLGVGAVALIVTLVFGSIKSFSVCGVGVAVAKTDPAVITEPTQPIEAAWYVTANISTSGRNSNTDPPLPTPRAN